MGISQKSERSFLANLTTFLFCFLVSLGAFIWFGSSFYQLVLQIAANTTVNIFHKGDFYLLGIGVGSGALAYIVLHEGILKLHITDRYTKGVSMSAIAGVIIMVLFPQVTHYSLEYIIEKRGYIICDLESSQWRVYRTFYYVSSVDACTNLIMSKK